MGSAAEPSYRCADAAWQKTNRFVTALMAVMALTRCAKLTSCRRRNLESETFTCNANRQQQRLPVQERHITGKPVHARRARS